LTLSNRDRVRLAVGDTDSTDPILTDDEVDDYLAQRHVVDSTGGTVYNVPAAAADCAGAIAAKYARDFSFAEDGQRFDRAQRVGHYQALERTLRARSGGVSAAVSLGGTAYST
jgi:hypothetical protein